MADINLEFLKRKRDEVLEVAVPADPSELLPSGDETLDFLKRRQLEATIPVGLNPETLPGEPITPDADARIQMKYRHTLKAIEDELASLRKYAGKKPSGEFATGDITAAIGGFEPYAKGKNEAAAEAVKIGGLEIARKALRDSFDRVEAKSGFLYGLTKMLRDPDYAREFLLPTLGLIRGPVGAVVGTLGQVYATISQMQRADAKANIIKGIAGKRTAGAQLEPWEEDFETAMIAERFTPTSLGQTLGEGAAFMLPYAGGIRALNQVIGFPLQKALKIPLELGPGASLAKRVGALAAGAAVRGGARAALNPASTMTNALELMTPDIGQAAYSEEADKFIAEYQPARGLFDAMLRGAGLEAAGQISEELSFMADMPASYISGMMKAGKIGQLAAKLAETQAGRRVSRFAAGLMTGKYGKALGPYMKSVSKGGYIGEVWEEVVNAVPEAALRGTPKPFNMVNPFSPEGQQFYGTTLGVIGLGQFLFGTTGHVEALARNQKFRQWAQKNEATGIGDPRVVKVDDQLSPADAIARGRARAHDIMAGLGRLQGAVGPMTVGRDLAELSKQDPEEFEALRTELSSLQAALSANDAAGVAALLRNDMGEPLTVGPETKQRDVYAVDVTGPTGKPLVSQMFGTKEEAQDWRDLHVEMNSRLFAEQPEAAAEGEEAPKPDIEASRAKLTQIVADWKAVERNLEGIRKSKSQMPGWNEQDDQDVEDLKRYQIDLIRDANVIYQSLLEEERKDIEIPWVSKEEQAATKEPAEQAPPAPEPVVGPPAPLPNRPLGRDMLVKLARERLRYLENTDKLTAAERREYNGLDYYFNRHPEKSQNIAPLERLYGVTTSKEQPKITAPADEPWRHTAEEWQIREDDIRAESDRLRDALIDRGGSDAEVAAAVTLPFDEKQKYEQHVADALLAGKYRDAIAAGEMTPTRVERILNSAGVAVPTDVLAEAEQLRQKRTAAAAVEAKPQEAAKPRQAVTLSDEMESEELLAQGVVSPGMKEMAEDGGQVVYVDGKPAGWVFVDGDGVLQVLELLPAYQRKTVGYNVLKQLFGGEPFRAFNPNEAARGMLSKYGQLTDQGDGFWLVKPTPKSPAKPAEKAPEPKLETEPPAKPETGQLAVGTVLPATTGYRAETGRMGRVNETVQDMVDFEADELGNEDVRFGADQAAKQHGLDLEAIPGTRADWVTLKPEDAEKYGEVTSVELPAGSIVLATDEAGGYLVLRPEPPAAAPAEGEEGEPVEPQPGPETVTTATFNVGKTPYRIVSTGQVFRQNLTAGGENLAFEWDKDKQVWRRFDGKTYEPYVDSFTTTLTDQLRKLSPDLVTVEAPEPEARAYSPDEDQLGDIVDAVYTAIADEVGTAALEDGDIVPRRLAVVGSHVLGTAKEGSDLDVVLEYEGPMREDDAFNMFARLRDEGVLPMMEVDGRDVRLDFNPIKAEKTGTLNEWLAAHPEYKNVDVKTFDFPAEEPKPEAEPTEHYDIAPWVQTFEELKLAVLKGETDFRMPGIGRKFVSTLVPGVKAAMKPGAENADVTLAQFDRVLKEKHVASLLTAYAKGTIPNRSALESERSDAGVAEVLQKLGWEKPLVIGKPVTDKYYTRDNDGKWYEVTGEPVSLPGQEGVDLFLHYRQEDGGWTIAEGSTGMAAGWGDTRQAAQKDLVDRMARLTAKGVTFAQAINDAISKTGVSPRYGGTGEIGVAKKKRKKAKKAGPAEPGVETVRPEEQKGRLPPGGAEQGGPAADWRQLPEVVALGETTGEPLDAEEVRTWLEQDEVIKDVPDAVVDLFVKYGEEYRAANEARQIVTEEGKAARDRYAKLSAEEKARLTGLANRANAIDAAAEAIYAAAVEVPAEIEEQGEEFVPPEVETPATEEPVYPDTEYNQPLGLSFDYARKMADWLTTFRDDAARHDDPKLAATFETLHGFYRDNLQPAIQNAESKKAKVTVSEVEAYLALLRAWKVDIEKSLPAIRRGDYYKNVRKSGARGDIHAGRAVNSALLNEISLIAGAAKGIEDTLRRGPAAPATEPAAGPVSAVDVMRRIIADGKGLPANKNAADALAKEMFGPNAGYDEVYDAIEGLATVEATRLAYKYRDDPEGFATAMRGLEQVLPTRTKTLAIGEATKQQFSTPFTFVEYWLDYAETTPTDVVQEPQAGTGNLIAPLLWRSKVEGTRIVLTEMEPRRAEVLREVVRMVGEDPAIPGGVGAMNVEVQNVNSLTQRPGDVKPTLIVMNPPWGSTGKAQHRIPVPLPYKANDQSLRFVQAALNSLPDGGRLIAVLPPRVMDSPGFSNYLESAHSPVAWLAVEGRDKYTKRGAGVEVGILIVDKGKGGEKLPTQARDVSVRTSAWPQGTTVAPGGTSSEKLRADPDFAAAKAGDTRAARRLVYRVTNPAMVDWAKGNLGPGQTLVPVIAYERRKFNKIPIALAQYLSYLSGAPVTTDIRQSVDVSHTGANAMRRMLSRPEFDGVVRPGQHYVLVDDYVTLGSTMSELADFIRRGGGIVDDVVALGHRVKTLSPELRQVRSIRRKYGATTVTDVFGVNPAALAKAEADYLDSFDSIDALRERIAKEGGRADFEGVGAEVGVRLPTRAREPKQPSWFIGKVTNRADQLKQEKARNIKTERKVPRGFEHIKPPTLGTQPKRTPTAPAGGPAAQPGRPRAESQRPRPVEPRPGPERPAAVVPERKPPKPATSQPAGTARPVQGVAPAQYGDIAARLEREDKAVASSSIYGRAPQRYTRGPASRPHPRLVVQSLGLLGALPPPDLNEYEVHPDIEAARQAVDERGMAILSDIQVDSIAASGLANTVGTIQPDGARQRHGALVSYGPGTGKGRIVAGICLDMLRKGEARLILVNTSREQNVKDLIKEFDIVGLGKFPYPVWDLMNDPRIRLSKNPGGRTKDTDPSLLRTMLAKEKGPGGEEQLAPQVVIMRANQMIYYTQALGSVPFDMLVADEAHEYRKLAANQRGAAWIGLHKRMFENYGESAKFAYLTATPGSELADLEALYGLREWQIGGFAEWLQWAIGAGDLKQGAPKGVEEVSPEEVAAAEPYTNAELREIGHRRGAFRPNDYIVRDARMVKTLQKANIFWRKDQTIADALIRLSVGVQNDSGELEVPRAGPDHWTKRRSGDVFDPNRLPYSVYEQVMRELYSAGKYMPGELWRGGTGFNIKPKQLSKEQVEHWDAVSRLIQDTQAAFEEFGKANTTRSGIRDISSQFQFFMKRYLYQLRLPDVIAEAKAAIARGEQPAISVKYVSAVERGEGNFAAAIRAINTLDVPVDEDGAAVESEIKVIPEAEMAKQKLLERVDDLGLNFPNPIDMIKDALGEENVADITGDTVAEIRSRELQDYQDGTRVAAVFSDAGQVGISMHHVKMLPAPEAIINPIAQRYALKPDDLEGMLQTALLMVGTEAYPIEEATKQAAAGSEQAEKAITELRAAWASGRRHVLLADTDWAADAFWQKLNRTDRTGQLTAPNCTYLSMNSGMERKFLGTIAARMAGLGAAAQGSADTSVKALDDFDMSGPASCAAMQSSWLKLPHDQKVKLSQLDRRFRADPEFPDFPTDIPRVNPKQYLLVAAFSGFQSSMDIAEAFAQERQRIIATSEKYETKTRRGAGKVVESLQLAPDLKLSVVTWEENDPDIEGKVHQHKTGILSGILRHRMRTIRKMVRGDDSDEERGGLTPHFITFTTERGPITGLQVAPGLIRAVARVFGAEVKGLKITPTVALQMLADGQDVPLMNGWRLHGRTDGSIQVVRLPNVGPSLMDTLVDKNTREPKYGVIYHAKGTWFQVLSDPDHFRKFVNRFKIEQPTPTGGAGETGIPPSTGAAGPTQTAAAGATNVERAEAAPEEQALIRTGFTGEMIASGKLLITGIPDAKGGGTVGVVRSGNGYAARITRRDGVPATDIRGTAEEVAQGINRALNLNGDKGEPVALETRGDKEVITAGNRDKLRRMDPQLADMLESIDDEVKTTIRQYGKDAVDGETWAAYSEIRDWAKQTLKHGARIPQTGKKVPVGFREAAYFIVNDSGSIFFHRGFASQESALSAAKQMGLATLVAGKLLEGTAIVQGRDLKKNDLLGYYRFTTDPAEMQPRDFGAPGLKTTDASLAEATIKKDGVLEMEPEDMSDGQKMLHDALQSDRPYNVKELFRLLDTITKTDPGYARRPLHMDKRVVAGLARMNIQPQAEWSIAEGLYELAAAMQRARILSVNFQNPQDVITGTTYPEKAHDSGRVSYGPIDSFVDAMGSLALAYRAVSPAKSVPDLNPGRLPFSEELRTALTNPGGVVIMGQKRVYGGEDVAAIMYGVKGVYGGAHELAVVVGMDTDNNVLGTALVAIGTVSAVDVDPRQVFAPLQLMGAQRYAFVHNHPSGNSTPSEDDRGIHRRLQLVASIMGIEPEGFVVTDHDEFTVITPAGDEAKHEAQGARDRETRGVQAPLLHYDVPKKAVLNPRNPAANAAQMFGLVDGLRHSGTRTAFAVYTDLSGAILSVAPVSTAPGTIDTKWYLQNVLVPGAVRYQADNVYFATNFPLDSMMDELRYAANALRVAGAGLRIAVEVLPGREGEAKPARFLNESDIRGVVDPEYVFPGMVQPATDRVNYVSRRTMERAVAILTALDAQKVRLDMQALAANKPFPQYLSRLAVSTEKLPNGRLQVLLPGHMTGLIPDGWDRAEAKGRMMYAVSTVAKGVQQHSNLISELRDVLAEVGSGDIMAGYGRAMNYLWGYMRLADSVPPELSDRVDPSFEGETALREMEDGKRRGSGEGERVPLQASDSDFNPADLADADIDPDEEDPDAAVVEAMRRVVQDVKMDTARAIAEDETARKELLKFITKRSKTASLRAIRAAIDRKLAATPNARGRFVAWLQEEYGVREIIDLPVRRIREVLVAIEMGEVPGVGISAVMPEGAVELPGPVEGEKVGRGIPFAPVLTNFRRFGYSGSMLATIVERFESDRDQLKGEWRTRWHNIYRAVGGADNWMKFIAWYQGVMSAADTGIDPKGLEAAASDVRDLFNAMLKAGQDVGVETMATTGIKHGLAGLEDYWPRWYRFTKHMHGYGWQRKFWTEHSDPEIREFAQALFALLDEDKDPYGDVAMQQRMVNWLIVHDKMEPADARVAIDALRYDMASPKFGFMERSREANLPVFRLDANVIQSYIEGAATRISWIDNFGQDKALTAEQALELGSPAGESRDRKRAVSVAPVNVVGIISQIPDKTARRYALRFFQENMEHLRRPIDNNLHKALGLWRTAQGVKLAMSWIPNMLQFLTNTWPEVGTKAMITGMAQAAQAYIEWGLGGKSDLMDFARYSGALSPQHTMELAEMNTAGHLGRIMHYFLLPFIAFEANNRNISAFAGRARAKELARRITQNPNARRLGYWKKLLERYGIDPDEVAADGSLTEEQMRDAAWSVSAATQFLARPGYKFLLWGEGSDAGEIVNTLAQFKFFAYSQTVYAARVFRSAYKFMATGGREGSVASLVQFMVMSALAGWIVRYIRDILDRFFTGRRGTTQVRTDAVLAKIGLPPNQLLRMLIYAGTVGGFGVGFDALMSAISGYDKWVYELVGGPSLSDVQDVFNRIFGAGTALANRKPEQAGQIASGIIAKRSSAFDMAYRMVNSKQADLDKIQKYTRAITDARTVYRKLWLEGKYEQARAYWDRIMMGVGKDLQDIYRKRGMPKLLKPPTVSDMRSWGKRQDDDPMTAAIKAAAGQQARGRRRRTGTRRSRRRGRRQ